MNVLLNFATLKKGGGQNVGLNFLHAFAKLDHRHSQYYFAVVKNSAIHNYLNDISPGQLILMPYNPLLRMIKEFFFGKAIINRFKIDIIYSYYGTGIFPKSIPQVSGSADSNIYFPEIDFWDEYSGVQKWKHELVDKYRIWGLKRMTAVVFENQMLETRCRQLYNIKNTIVIKPSISLAKEQDEYLMKDTGRTGKIFRGLFFCSWQRNKNFMIVPRLASRLKKAGIEMNFILTADKDGSNDYKEFCRQLDFYDVTDIVQVVGTVQKKHIRSLYAQIDFVFLLSKLESFSNNIIEAWSYCRVLMVADEAWARAICGDAAVYVSRNDEKDISDKIVELISFPEKLNNVISAGQAVLATYPTLEERTGQEIKYLEFIYQNA